MRMHFKVLVAAMGVLGLSAQAEALTITPSTAGCLVTPVCLQTSGDENSQAEIDAALMALLGAAYVEGYKAEVDDGSESGPGAPYYSTEFLDEPDDPSGAVISWDGPLYFQASPLYLLVKDGNHEPGWYLFRIAVGAGGWDGMEDLVLDDFWPDQGAISHLTIVGNPGTQFFNPVPDGGSTTMLLGMGLLGLAALRRRLGRL